ncbi:MAG: hypothetical protein ACYTG0_33625 [Planctomycetota bacterium]|jgi:hypothetical protein
MNSTENNPSSTPRGHPWQFGVRTLLWVTLGMALALGIVVSSPSAIAVPVMMCLAITVPAVLTVVLIYGSTYQRTFCIGALFPSCVALYATGWLFGVMLFGGPQGDGLDSLDEWLELFDYLSLPCRVYVGGAWLLAVIVGSLAVGVRWQLERTARRNQGDQNVSQS